MRNVSLRATVTTSARYAVSRFRRDDHRIGRKIAAKCGRIQRNRTGWILHNTTKKLADHAKQNSLYAMLENLNGIRRLYLRGNGQGAGYRGRMKVARKILNAGLRFGLLGLSREAVKGNLGRMVIPRVDDSQSSARMLITEQPKT